MKSFICLILCLAMLLSGCSTIFDGHYNSVTPHTEKVLEAEGERNDANSFQDLCFFLNEMVRAHAASGIISVPEYNQATLVQDVREAIQHTITATPLGSYSVETINFNLGTNSGKAAVAVEITYSKTKTQMNNIVEVASITDAQNKLIQVLSTFETGILLLVQDYEQFDISQWIANYYALYPDILIEQPKVTVNTYPDSGTTRLLELTFSYQTKRESLREMQESVRPFFDAAAMYVSEDDNARTKYEKLFSFLIDLQLENFDHRQETSLTPIYSLLLHGVGDSKAIAMTYAAMCRKANLECVTVSGAKAGVPWSWNIVKIDGVYYHIDLLASQEANQIRFLSDANMQTYVWDYSSYPSCGV